MNADDVLSDVKSSMAQRKIRRFSEPGRGRRVRCPEEVLRDIRGLKLRQRVSLVLADELLKDELEQTIKNSTVNGVTRADTIRTYQDFLLPQAQPGFVNIGGSGGAGSGMVVLPVNDIKGSETLGYSKVERQKRNKLAAVYRLVELLGWSEAIYNHISVRAANDSDEFLINPFGLLYNEVTASSLIKCDLQGNVIDGGSTNLGLNKAGFILHSTIHEYRPDLNCIIHVHSPDVIVVASMKCGFLRISQESLIVGNVSYHDYWGILVNDEEKESIREDLGPKNKVMILRNHGAVICGSTVEQAFGTLITFMDACSTQVKAMACGLENLNLLSDEAFEQVQEIVQDNKKAIMTEEGKSQLGLDDLTFEAYMRWMDAQGYRTGYSYRMPDLFTTTDIKKFPQSQVPPQVTSDRVNPYQAYYDSQSPSVGRGNTHRNRYKWLNNPTQGTQYKKEFIEKQAPQIQPPVLDDMPSSINGHVEEKVSTEVSSNVNDTKVVTKTTTVTETQVITEISGGQKNETVKQTVVNGNQVHADSAMSPVEEQNEKPPAKSEDTASSKADSSQEIASETSLSPNKVKKQKSFKKTLMNKFKKHEK